VEFYYHSVDKDILILSADGGLNMDNADQFVTELETVVESGIRKLIVDCTKLNYISSWGMRILTQLHKKLAAHGGDVKLAGVQSPIMRLLELVKLDRSFQIYPNVDEARKAFGSK
jgi:anti-sigma B factor antagonist